MAEQRQVVVCIPGGAMGLTPKVVSTILTQAALAGGATTVLADCNAIDLSGGEGSLMLSIELDFDGAAVAGARVHVLTAPVDDVADYDTVDWDTWDVGFTAGATVRQSHNYDVCPAFVRVQVENLDAVQNIANLTVRATVGA